MAHDGYLRYGATEVVNTERLAAYVDHGLVPVRVDVPDPADGLAAIAAGDAAYATPLVDRAPWVDLDNPDTYDFVGLLPLELTGLDDTTRTVEMIRTTRDGALPGTARRGPSTIGATALLLGRTTAGVYAGLAWLERVLHGACETADQACGPSATLEFFSVSPGPVYPTANRTAPLVSHITRDPNDPAYNGGQWVTTGGTFLEPDRTGTRLVPYTPKGYDGGRYNQAINGRLDGGDDTDVVEVVDGGGVGGVAGRAVLAGPAESCNDGPVTITWTVQNGSDSPDDNTVQLGVVDASGTFVEVAETYIINRAVSTAAMRLPQGIAEDQWRPAIVVPYPAVVQQVEVTSYPLLDPLACIAPYRRYRPRTVTTAGPTVVEEIQAGCLTLLRVEWVWVAGSPYRYGVTTTVLAGLSDTAPATLSLPGVTSGRRGTISAAPWDCAPPAPETDCGTDPNAPGFTAPPRQPFITDPARPRITTQQVRAVWACVGPEQTPANDGVFTITLTATGRPVVGARVRVYDTTQGDCTVPDLCDFAYEYLIDYVPTDGVLTIDGVDGTFTTLCDGGNVIADVSAGVAGNYGGPTREPVARCNRRYLIEVHWLDTYPRAGGTTYTQGQPQGSLSLAVSVTPREG